MLRGNKEVGRVDTELQQRIEVAGGQIDFRLKACMSAGGHKVFPDFEVVIKHDKRKMVEIFHSDRGAVEE